MWRIFRKSAQTGIVTKDMPEQTEAKGFQGPPHIIFDRCTACGICTGICPAGALTLTKNELVQELALDRGACVFCNRCVNACPEQALVGSRKFHWAAKKKADLVLRGRCGKG
jgi:formate hydrogenlyase subunit 6/NADH:ubiquinone oxidoreductase subunit I